MSTARMDAAVPRPPVAGGEGGLGDDVRLGARIRRLRHARSLTLVQLAAATGLSHPFLSQLERGLAQPSLTSLRRIALALDTSPIELIEAGDEPGRVAPPVEVQRAGNGGVPKGFSAGEARLLAHGVRAFRPMEVVGHGGAWGEPITHDEDEFLYVADGAVELETGDVRHTLVRGDSAYYAGGTTHRWRSADGAPFRLVVVKQAPSAARG